ncbi:MAG: two-component system, NarL family, sensor kinase [Solirubrobacteraceae bacterium]|nr:two-component system, NarL family, sensor kinase [Solirubrobacteraceae bacterium]
MSARASTLRRIVSTRPAPNAAAGDAPLRSPASGRRVALVQFAVCSIALLVVAGTIGAVVLRHVATNEALRDARTLTVALSRAVIRDRMTPRLLGGDRAALVNLDRAIRERVLGDPIIRIKIWTPEGRIVYSDAPSLIGRRFTLPDDLRETLESGAAAAAVSDLGRPENRLERSRGRLVEVYLPLRGPAGDQVLVEAYHPSRNISSAGHRIWRSLLPVLLAVLAALAVAQLPLAWFLARRVRAEERERERLARRADHALEAERHRIAAELHDGVVQDLAGVAYELQAAADRAPSTDVGGELANTLRRGAGVCRGSMRALRALLLDLYPSERRAHGLDDAVEQLAQPLRERGVHVAVDIGVAGTLPTPTAEILYRAAQEALRNVERHAAARTAIVALTEDVGDVTLVIEDDGRGMTGDNLREQHAAGHMGLALLADGVAARGGSLSIESEPGAGTRVTVSLPRDAGDEPRSSEVLHLA